MFNVVAQKLCSKKEFRKVSICLILSIFIVQHNLKAQQYDTLITQKGRHTQLTITTKSGLLQEVIRLKDSMRDGIQERYAYNGKLSDKIEFENGHPEGKWLVYDYNEKLREQKHYHYKPEIKASVLNGFYQQFMNEIVIQEGNYVDSMRDGLWKEYYHKGKLRTKATYANDLLTGERIEFDAQGHVIGTSTNLIIEENGKQKSVLHGKASKFDIDGNLISESYYDKGMKEGTWKTWQSGKLNSLQTFKNNKKHGPYETYQNNVLQSKGCFYEEIMIDGLMMKNVYEGSKEEYNYSGKPQRIEHYLKGKKNGSFERYTETGILQERSEYNNDLLIGKFENYDYKGNKTFEVNYKIIQQDTIEISVKHGKEYRWNNQILISESNFVDGKEDGERISYSNKGNVIERLQFKQNLLSGKLTSFFENGQIKSIRNYGIFTDITGKKMSVNHSWQYEYKENGQMTNASFLDTNGKTILTLNYQDGRLTQYACYEFFEINYFPNHQVMSFKVNNRYRQLAYAQHYYLNGKTRKISFQNPENLQVNHVDFSDQGEQIFGYSDANQNPDSLKPSAAIVQKMSGMFGSQFLPNSLYDDTLLNGTYELKYTNGKTLMELHFADNLPNGNFLIVDPIYGDTLIFRNYVKGIQQGYFVEKFAGKHIIHRGSIRSALGEWNETYNVNGNPIQKYKNNEKGERITANEYYEDGKIKSIVNYSNGTFSYFDNKGNVYYESELIQDTPKIRVQREYHSNSTKIKSIKYYKNETQDSLALTYFENGQLQTSMNYINGKREGMYLEYIANGQLKRQGEFLHDQSQGLWIVVDGNKTDSVYYENGKATVRPSGLACSCVDTSYSANKIRFMPSLNGLIEYAKIKKFFPYYFVPIDSLNYKSIFYSGFQTSNNGSSGFSTMKLFMFKELSIRVPADEQFKLTFNPCRTQGYISNMEVYANYSTNDARQTIATFNPKKIALEFLKGPLKSDDKNYVNVTSLFDVDEVEFKHVNGFDIKLNNDSTSCTSKGILKNYLHLDFKHATPFIFKNPSDLASEFYMAGIDISSAELRYFFGIWSAKANAFFYHSINQQLYKVEAYSNGLLAGGQFVTGEIIIPCSKTGLDDYLIETNEKPLTISSQELKMEWLKKGFTRIEIKFNEKDMALHLNFYAE